MIGLNTDIVNHKDIIFNDFGIFFKNEKRHYEVINYNIKKLSLIAEGVENVKSIECFYLN